MVILLYPVYSYTLNTLKKKLPMNHLKVSLFGRNGPYSVTNSRRGAKDHT